jgi:hypothetical protein
LLNNCIETSTFTPHTQKVPIAVVTLLFTIIAHNINYPGQIIGHRLKLNISGTSLPGRSHGSFVNYGLFADRATIVESCQVSETMAVNRMATW